MNWNRKEVGGLLLVGASIISGFQTALFSKWVDAKLVTNTDIARIISRVGFVSVICMTAIWIASRVYMNKNLLKTEKLNWKISVLFILGFLAMAVGWLIS